MKKKYLWGLFVLIVLLEINFLILINRLQMVSGYGILDAMIYNKDIVNQVIRAYGQEGIAIYHQIQVLDIIFPLTYGTLLVGLIHKKTVVIFPVIAAIADLSENICIRIMIDSYPDTINLYTLSFVFTSIKFILIMLSIVIAVYIKLQNRRKVLS